MPLYEYRCEKCGKTFEIIQKFSDAALEVHPDCGGRVERLLSAPAFQFKGSGWYVTDYARGSSKTGGEAKGSGESKSGESRSESKSDSGGESKSESKSESKAESKSESKSESRSKDSKPAPANKD